jgi:hypothetical protein
VIKRKDDINWIVNDLRNNMTHSFVDIINAIRDKIKKARASEDDPNSRSQIDVYKD